MIPCQHSCAIFSHENLSWYSFSGSQPPATRRLHLFCPRGGECYIWLYCIHFSCPWALGCGAFGPRCGEGCDNDLVLPPSSEGGGSSSGTDCEREMARERGCPQKLAARPQVWISWYPYIV